MATGTGKTLTALGAVAELCKMSNAWQLLLYAHISIWWNNGQKMLKSLTISLYCGIVIHLLEITNRFVEKCF